MKTSFTYPREHSITARILARMLLGEELTHRETDKAAGTYRLAGYVGYIKSKHKWPHESEQFIDDSLDPVGRKAPYTKYWLSIETIRWAGQQGKDFANRVLGREAKQIAQRAAATAPNAGASSKRTNEHQHSNKEGKEESHNGPQ
jgi:hypothetical protein